MGCIDDLVETQNRYFRYEITMPFGDPIADSWDGSFTVNLPPLSEVGFTQNYQTCLAKVKRVFISGSKLNSGIAWSKVSSNPLVEYIPKGGISFITNMATRNQAFMGTDTEGESIISSMSKNVLFQRFGCNIPNIANSVVEDTQVARLVENHTACIEYRDDSDIKSSGLLTSVPFGQNLSFFLSPAEAGADTEKLVAIDSNPDVGVPITGSISLTLEFLMIN